MCTNHDKIQENPITPETIALLNSFGFVGPKGNQPEFCNVEGVMTAYLKKGRFGIQAQPGAEGGKPYISMTWATSQRFNASRVRQSILAPATEAQF